MVFPKMASLLYSPHRPIYDIPHTALLWYVIHTGLLMMIHIYQPVYDIPQKWPAYSIPHTALFTVYRKEGGAWIYSHTLSLRISLYTHPTVSYTPHQPACGIPHWPADCNHYTPACLVVFIPRSKTIFLWPLYHTNLTRLP